MNPVLAFVVVMLVWTVSDFVAKKTKSLLSSLFVASIIFLIGFLTGIFPEDLLASSSLLALAGVVVGFIIVHLGTMIGLDDFKKQWRTLLVGIATVIGIGVALFIAGLIFGGGVRPDVYDGVAAARPHGLRHRRRGSPERWNDLRPDRPGSSPRRRAHLRRGVSGPHRRAPRAHRVSAHLDHPASRGSAPQG